MISYFTGFFEKQYPKVTKSQAPNVFLSVPMFVNKQGAWYARRNNATKTGQTLFWSDISKKIKAFLHTFML